MPAFAPVDSDEDGGDDSVFLKAVPVGMLDAPVTEAKSSVHDVVSDTKKEYSDGRDIVEGVKVSTIGVDLETEA